MEKKLRIFAKCGRHSKEVTFPITPEIEQHLLGLQLSDYNVEGSKSVTIQLSTIQYDRKV